jgi:hypothetical protein
MTRSLVRLFLVTLLVCAPNTLASAQSATATLSGVVVDSAGGVIPGAAVVAKNNATAETFDAVTNSTGAFSIPALGPGTYTVTISLEGFKTAVVSDVRLVTATPSNIKAVLEVGRLAETVTVKAGSEIVQTQSSAVTSTIGAEQIRALPLVTRNALYFTTTLAGVETQGGPRGSTIMGLPQNTINITIDGISTGNNLQSTDGFFSMVTPRVDAIEEITVTGATPGANNAGAGAVQIAFTTRSGTNTLNSSVYHYFRHPSLNSNYYFNKINGLDRNDVILHNYGGRVGGPITIPGLFDGRDKAFFFFNMDLFYQPTEATRQRTIFSPEAQRGLFLYTANGVTRQINLLALAATNGQTSTIDPNIGSLLALINAGMQTTGTVSTPSGFINTQRYAYQSASKRNEYAPTGRVDINLNSSNRLSGSYAWQRIKSNPDLLNGVETPFPGLTNYGIQASYRTFGSATLRSTLGSNLVNEVKTGWQWSPLDFYGNITASMFENQGGFSLGLSGGPNNTDFSNVTGATATRNLQPRNTTNWNIDDNLNWLKGKHSLSMGASFTQIIHDQNSEDVVPSIGFSVDTTNDPARTMFATTNFPNASANQLSMARHLYAVLTGRITSINGTARLNEAGEYVYLGNLNQKSRMNELGVYVQDSWRATPTVTLNGGLRWELQLPFQAITNTWSTATMADICGKSGLGTGPGGRQCNLFQPGNLAAPTAVPQYIRYEPGRKGYNTDWNNLAPNAGLAWRPNVQNGWLRALLGDPDQATVRGGYSLTFNRERMDRFTGLFGGNVGGTTNVSNRTTNNANLIRSGEFWPLLYREKSRLGPPEFAKTPNYPITASITAGNDINIFDPDLVVPSTQSWSVGFQRSIGRDTAVEVRYVGNRNRNAWTTENWNAANIFENKFLDEFKLAQANLAANVAAGRGGTFAYMGPGTGTSPLPVFLAYFQGLPASRATDPAAYTSAGGANSAQFTNSTYTDQLGYFEPGPRSIAGNLWTGNSGVWRANAAAAGIPANYFVLNPDVDQANVTRSLAGSRYHSMQLEVRRRLSKGLTVQGNYTYARRWGSSLEDLHRERIYLETDAVPHAIKANWVYEIPIGRQRRFGSNMSSWLNAVIGNWEFAGNGRLQVRDFGVTGLKIVGMTEKELKDAFRIRTVRSDTGTVTLFNLPDDIITNTRRAFSTDPTAPTGYPEGESPIGRYLAPASSRDCIFLFNQDCGTKEQVWVRGPWFSRWDFTAKKRFPFAGKSSVEFAVEVLNVFDNVNFNPNFNPGGGNTIFQVTSGYTDINNTFDPGGRLGQIVWRVNW